MKEEMEIAAQSFVILENKLCVLWLGMAAWLVLAGSHRLVLAGCHHFCRAQS